MAGLGFSICLPAELRIHGLTAGPEGEAVDLAAVSPGAGVSIGIFVEVESFAPGVGACEGSAVAEGDLVLSRTGEDMFDSPGVAEDIGDSIALGAGDSLAARRGVLVGSGLSRKRGVAVAVAVGFSAADGV